MAKMGFLNLFQVELDRVLNLSGSVVGIAGFLFGPWRYFNAPQHIRHLSALSSGFPECAKAA
jgi:hypothetical protein